MHAEKSRILKFVSYTLVNALYLQCHLDNGKELKMLIRADIKASCNTNTVLKNKKEINKKAAVGLSKETI